MRSKTISEQLFFELLRAGLWEKEASLLPFEDDDLKDVYRIAEEQSVVGIVAAGLDHVKDVTVPKVELLQFVGQALQIEQQNAAMNGFIRDLISLLRANEIYTLLVKGQGVAQCYEKPLWRSCGDIDLFLSDENYEKAKKLLIPKASSVEKESLSSKHLGLTIDSWVVELHGLLYSSLSPRIFNILCDIKDDTFYRGNVRSWSNGTVQVFLLAAENDAVYIFTHFLGHFYKGGVGLRQICDWCRLLWTYRDVINESSLESRIRKAGLISEWKAFGSFAVNYLGMPSDAMPLYSDKAYWKAKASLIHDFILDVGNFGHNRDTTFLGKKPYLIRKMIALGIRTADFFRHARLFPMDTMRFFPIMIFNGLRSAVRGE